MKGGPASNIAVFTKECKEKRLRAFYSYRTKKDLKELLAKYGIDGNSMDNIPLFELQTHTIQDSDEYYKHCMKEIMVRLKNYGILVVNTWRLCEISTLYQFFILQSILQEMLQKRISA